VAVWDLGVDEHPLLEASEWMESKDCEGWARLVWAVQEWELGYRCLQLLYLALSFLSLKSGMQHVLMGGKRTLQGQT